MHAALCARVCTCLPRLLLFNRRFHVRRMRASYGDEPKNPDLKRPCGKLGLGAVIYTSVPGGLSSQQCSYVWESSRVKIERGRYPLHGPHGGDWTQQDWLDRVNCFVTRISLLLYYTSTIMQHVCFRKLCLYYVSDSKPMQSLANSSTQFCNIMFLGCIIIIYSDGVKLGL